MTKLNATIAAVTATLFMTTGAMAASFQPASGQAPFFGSEVSTAPSTLTRAEVQAQAASAFPAAGNTPFANHVVATGNTPTRAAVEAQAAANPPAAGEMNGYQHAQSNAVAVPTNAQASSAASENRS